MMNEREILILQIKQGTGEWEDITKQVQWFDAKKNACRIKYVGNANFYWKSWRDLIIYNKPVIVELLMSMQNCFLLRVTLNWLAEAILSWFPIFPRKVVLRTLSII